MSSSNEILFRSAVGLISTYCGSVCDGNVRQLVGRRQKAVTAVEWTNYKLGFRICYQQPVTKIYNLFSFFLEDMKNSKLTQFDL